MPKLRDTSVVFFSCPGGRVIASLLASLGCQVAEVQLGTAGLTEAQASSRAGRVSVLDLRVAADRDQAKQLVKGAQVVIQGGSAGETVLSYDEMRSVQPSIVVLNVTLLGEAGTVSDARVHTSHIVALSGLMSELLAMSHGTLRQALPAYADSQTGIVGLVAVLAALRKANRTGVGAYVDLSQWEAVMSGLDLLFLERQSGLARRPGRQGWHTPRGIFPAAGDDNWVAIACRTDQQWLDLCETLDLGELLEDQSLHTLLGRINSAARIEKCLADATQRFERNELSRILQAKGIPAAPVLTPAEASNSGPVLSENAPDASGRLPWRSMRRDGSRQESARE